MFIFIVYNAINIRNLVTAVSISFLPVLCQIRVCSVFVCFSMSFLQTHATIAYIKKYVLYFISNNTYTYTTNKHQLHKILNYTIYNLYIVTLQYYYTLHIFSSLLILFYKKEKKRIY